MDKQKFAMQSSDPEPEDANARLQSPPVEVRIDSTMQLCSDSLYMHVLECICTACQGIFLDATACSGFHASYIVPAALALLHHLWKCCSCISLETPLYCASKCTMLPIHQ